MNTECMFNWLAHVGRILSAALGILVLCFVAVVLIVWLVLTKQTQSPVHAKQETATNVDEEMRVQALVNQIQAMKVEHAKQIDGYKRVTANLKAQIAALTPRVNRIDDQLAILNEAAQRTPQPMTDRELETKTKQVLGIVGKVVSR